VATASDDTEVRACVCLPTYDEHENLEPMLRALARVLGPDDRVLVIDDNSPDGTGELADRLAAELTFVDVLHRERKQGLGPAYLAGFRRALDAGAELVLEMDCDFSHDPKDVPRLLEAAADADLVLGSRYVAGGGVEDWDLLRRVLSRGGCRYARSVLGVGVRDLTGGFKCFRADTLRAIDFETVRSEGYAFQVELTYRALARGLRVEEVPITFRDRSAGDSKMSARIALEAIWLVPALRLARRRDGLPEAPGSGEPGTLPIP
jgi:dolichol-phosphate mannosyltransferase